MDHPPSGKSRRSGADEPRSRGIQRVTLAWCDSHIQAAPRITVTDTRFPTR
ncbi:hypothetical protein [Aromatoleum tolulyticum]|uniref:hypothetical protein n=1 Tax=Aromatoleum tolulyticum TaxID=34027 RepID=UPI0014831650